MRMKGKNRYGAVNLGFVWETITLPRGYAVISRRNIRYWKFRWMPLTTGDEQETRDKICY
ncbi:hypothetical protein CW304_27140 [Bacillus sp. UFRGS-B20]|nr:hypothetical protein CW304_27140 [Bacillus sp. UFRGS-B20]